MKFLKKLVKISSNSTKKKLFAAIKNGKYGDVKSLVKKNKGLVDKTDSNDFTTLFWACHYGYSEIFALLFPLCKRKTIDKKNRHGDDLLQVVCSGGNVEIVKLLIADRGAEKVNRTNNYDWTPLYRASENGHIQVVKELLPHCTKKTINMIGNFERTALYRAFEEKHLKVIALLLMHGAVVDKKTEEKANGMNGGHQFVDIVLDYDKAKNKVDFVKKSKKTLDNRLFVFLVELVLGRCIDICTHDAYKSIETTVFYKIYQDKEIDLKEIFDTNDTQDVCSFIKIVLQNKKSDLHMDFMCIKEREQQRLLHHTRNNKKYVDCTVKTAT